MNESNWIFLVVWIFATVFGLAKRDPVVKMIAAIIGMIYGIFYLQTSFLLSLGLILLNFYLLYEAIVS